MLDDVYSVLRLTVWGQDFEKTYTKIANAEGEQWGGRLRRPPFYGLKDSLGFVKVLPPASNWAAAQTKTECAPATPDSICVFESRQCLKVVFKQLSIFESYFQQPSIF